LCQLFGAMGGVGVEEQAVSALHGEELFAVAVHDLAFQHIKKLHALVRERREHVGGGGERDQVGLNSNAVCLCPIADASLSGTRLAGELDSLTARRGKPRMIVSDNGTEMSSMAILK